MDLAIGAAEPVQLLSCLKSCTAARAATSWSLTCCSSSRMATTPAMWPSMSLARLQKRARILPDSNAFASCTACTTEQRRCSAADPYCYYSCCRELNHSIKLHLQKDDVPAGQRDAPEQVFSGHVGMSCQLHLDLPDVFNLRLLDTHNLPIQAVLDRLLTPADCLQTPV